MKSFAGFWRDGAVVLPEDRHADATGFVIRFSKNKEEFSLCHAMRPSVLPEFYWLDTTTPTELTPQEAFECYKTVYPDAKGISKTTHGYTVQLGNGGPIINWGDITEYPPKKKWRVPTDADKGKRCRYKDEEKAEWMNRDNVLFMSTWNEGFWIVYGNEAPCFWKHCEVLDE